MKTRLTTRSALRLAAGLLLAGTIATWATTGAHPGWSRTSVTEMHQDEITGIDYPVQKPGFVAGVDFLGAGAGLALGLAGLSLIGRPRPARAA